MKIEGILKGQLEINGIEFKEIYQRRVSPNNDTSGKVAVPTDLIGKQVLVVLPKKLRK